MMTSQEESLYAKRPKSSYVVTDANKEDSENRFLRATNIFRNRYKTFKVYSVIMDHSEFYKKMMEKDYNWSYRKNKAMKYISNHHSQSKLLFTEPDLSSKSSFFK